MAERENYFILLGLSFDPIENDSGKINAAITAKQQQWSKDMTNPIRKVKAAEYLAQLETIKSTMLNDTTRKSEAAAAKKLRDGKAKELGEKLQLYAAKGDELSDKDLKLILKNFSSYGFTEEAVKRQFKSILGQKSQGKIDVSAVIDKSQAKNIKNFMVQIDMKDKTLYDFLSLPASSSCAQLCDTAEAMKKKILAKGDKTGSDNARQSLCGLCSVVFKDKQAKQKYDNYVELTKYGKLNDAIDEMALSNNRVIEPKMKDGLVDIACQNYSISPSEASIYISNYCEMMEYQEKDKSVICGLCNTENPGGATVCVKCGKPLIITCPSCGSANGNATKNCVKCGFDLTKMDRALELIAKAKSLWTAKKPDEAEACIKEAKLYWPNHQEIVSLGQEIAAFKDKVGKILGNISAAVTAKKYYAAQLAVRSAKAEGYAVSADIEAKITSVITDVEARLKKLATMSDDDAFETLCALVEIITDSVEVNERIKIYPPEVPVSFSAEKTKGTISLKWSKSPSRGRIEYTLVRKENTPSNTITDGERLYSGTELSYSDATPKKSVVYCYTLFATRAGVVSKAAHLDAPMVVVDNVSNIKPVGGDNLIVLSWDKPATVTEVKIGLYKGDSQPTSTAQYQSVKCNRLDGVTLSDLQNGQRYWISIQAFHTISGRAFPSEMTFVNAVPQKPAEMIENFSLSYVGEIFHAKWDKADWDVVMFYTNKKPSYTPNIVYSYNDLVADYKPIDIALKNLTEAEFTLSFIGQCYILPGQISGSNVILNDYTYISSVPAVKDPSFDINASRTEVYVNFTWPKKLEKTLLVYRTDTYPEGHSDPLASRVECGKKQYESNEGILLSNVPTGKLYASIYSFVEVDGDRVYSSAVNLIIQNEPQRDVYYSFKYKKAFLSKKRTLFITIHSNDKFVFPPFCVISKYKTVPLNRGDGEIVCSCTEDKEIDKTYTFEFDVEDLRADTRLKLFFVNDKNYRYYKILNDGGSTI